MSRDNELPGAYPYTRGIYPNMYRERLWTMRQYAGYRSCRDTNRRLKRLLAEGQTGLSLAFDLPTQLGLDADDESAKGEVGKTGVCVSSLSDFEETLRGISLADTSLSMTINATAPALLAMTIAAADRSGVSHRLLRGTVQNDMLKEYAARNAYVLPPEPSLAMSVDIIEFCCRTLPGWYPISVSGYHLREAGATAAQEIGFAIANALTVLESAMTRGLDADEVAPRFSFFFAACIDLLEETAKFRAARRIWAKLMRERYRAKHPKAWSMRFHAQTAGSQLYARQHDNNIVRVTLQALSAVLGGAQSLHTNAKDEAIQLPTAASATLALRTQQIIAYESGLAERIDPLFGSCGLEAETDRLEQEAVKWIEWVEHRGGSLQAIRNGSMQREIHAAAYRTFLEMEHGTKAIVGVNRFVEPPSMRPVTGRKALRGALREEERAAAALQKHRKTRNQAAASRTLSVLMRAAEAGSNIMPDMIHAVAAGNTVGEIYGAFTKLFGLYQGVTALEEETECTNKQLSKS